ncbi:hypothetical protein CANCADRAFT_12539, partial [Tortispora caseinolytica NRRL Y-17796]
RSSGDQKHTLTVPASTAVLTLKEQLESVFDIPPNQQRLIYSGRVLKDEEPLSTYKVKSGHIVHLVKSAILSNATSNTSRSSSTPVPPVNMAAGQGVDNPLADLTGARYAGLANLPPASMFGPDGGMNNIDQDSLMSLLDDPASMQLVQSYMQDDRVINSLINSPMFRQQLGPSADHFANILRNPEARRLMFSPEVLRQSSEISRAMQSGNFPNPFAALSGAGGAAGAAGTAGTTGTGGNTDGSDSGNTNAGNTNPFASLLNPDLLSLLGTPGLAGAGTAAQPDNRPPEERYEDQLRQLNELGFYDFDKNVRALRRSGGNVQGAIEALLDN